jgi:hypothetical protein
MSKHLIHHGEEFTIELPYSEVCMHLRVAGTRMRARLEPNQMVQLLAPDGSRFSFPITAAEAGLDTDGQGAWWVTVDARSDQLGEELSVEPQVADPRGPRQLLDAISEPLTIPDRHRWRGDIVDGPGGPLCWHPDLGYLPDPHLADGP